MRAAFAFLSTVVVVVGACNDSTVATENTLGAPAAPAAAISDARHSGGNPFFFFLPPMVANPDATGTADGMLSPVVDICALADDACDAVIAQFTTDLATTTTTHPGHSEVVRTSEDHYLVSWHTREFGLDADVTYRICVSVDGQGLGHADVDVVDAGPDLKDVDADAFFPLRNGRTLPIKFRVEEGAVGPDAPDADEACGEDGGGGEPT